MIEILVIAFLLCYIAFKEYIHHEERKTLMNRIQAKDTNELIRLENKPKQKKKDDEEKKEYNFL